MSATRVYYNGVTMNDVLTQQWDEEVVYDNSGTDPLYTKVRLKFTGILHTEDRDESLPYISGPFSSIVTTVETRIEEFRQRMMLPRGEFSLTCNGNFMLQVTGSESQTPASAVTLLDVRNGPKPISFEISNVWGGRVFRVSWTVEICIQRFCFGASSPVLNNRWSVAESIDAKKYLTRTIRGELRLASYQPLSPMIYKALVIPELEDGFRCESIEYSVSPDGLTCQYSVVDKQIDLAAPWPAAEVDVRHTESTNNGVTLISSASANLMDSLAHRLPHWCSERCNSSMTG